MKAKRFTGMLLSLALILSLAFAGFASNNNAGDDLAVNCDCSDPNYVGYE
jgi:hypothetical protein